MHEMRLDFPKSPDLAILRSEIIDAGVPKIAQGRLEKIEDHLNLVYREFSGKPRILYYHAWLIVRIRRGERRFKEFERLWHAEREFLLKTLSLRWLVSASDTFADRSSEDTQRTIALATTLLVATVKLYETERYLVGPEYVVEDEVAKARTPKELFDGVTSFSIGHGDMVKNLVERCKEAIYDRGISGSIFKEALKRLHVYDTVFRRLQILHMNDSTRWTP